MQGHCPGVYRYILACLTAFFCLSAGLNAQVSPEDIEMDETTRRAAADTLSQRVVQPEDTLTGPSLMALARHYGDSVVIRWGASDYVHWQAASDAGFMVERLRLQRDMSTARWEGVNNTPIKPLTIDEWRAGYRPEDSLAGAAVQTLYGKAITTTEDQFGAIYEMHLQQANFYSIAHLLADLRPDLADGLGLRLVDRDFQPGETYLYRVFAVGATRLPIDTATVLVEGETFNDYRAIKSLRAAEGEQQIILQWDRREHPDVNFSAYSIERSYDGVNFERLTSTPYIPAVDEKTSDEEGETVDVFEYRVKLEENYKPASYRVRGVDAFGEYTRGDTVIAAMGRDKTAPGQPRMDKYDIVQDGRSVQLNWHMDSMQVHDDLTGFFVAKAPDTDGPYEPLTDILAPDTRSWVDPDVVDLPQHYYVVGSVDTAGNTRLSVPVLVMFPDSIPPATPRNLTGEIDTLGRVTLTWDANEEDDLQGYRVFYAHQGDHEFQQLTQGILVDTVFYDSLTVITLSEEIIYKVTALDENFNHSEFSEPLVLHKPDVVPPAAAVISDVIVTDSAVTISWRRSPSDDAVLHRIMRREQGGTDWLTLIDVASETTNIYADTSALRGTVYEYGVEVQDDAGLVSPLSNVVAGRVYDSGVRSGVHGLTVTQDESGAVLLSWEYSGDPGASFYIYRAVGEASPSLVRSLESTERTFRDAEVRKGMKVRYAVKTVTTDGGESALVASRDLELR